MCRFTLYLGPPIRLSTLLFEPEHSLIRQSYQARERPEPLNGDGFGVGWYQPEITAEPGLFRSVSPAWNNTNLASLARVVASPCVLAHVRAATPGMTVGEANCHPFPWGRYLFMHNGHVGSFHDVRRSLLNSLGDEAFDLIAGSTDTEHLFAVFVDELLREGEGGGGLALAECLRRAVWRVVRLVRGAGGAPSFLNLAVSDGEGAVACRFTDAQGTPPESLYYIRRGLYPPAWPSSPGRRRHERSPSVLVASEALTTDAAWRAVPPNHLILLERERPPLLFRMGEDALEEAAPPA